MIRASFGKRLSHLPTAPVIQVVLVPKGAAASSDIWAMGEALHMFVAEAQERALFRIEGLPQDAIAVFRAYELASALSNWTLGDWHREMRLTPEQIDQTILGLRLIGSNEIADVAARAKIAWLAGEPLDQFTTSREMEEPLIGQCSAWVRHSPLTRVLGDGQRDTVYKEVMKALGRCNPNYARRRVAEDEGRRMRRIRPLAPLEGEPCTLDELIAEMQLRYG